MSKKTNLVLLTGNTVVNGAQTPVQVQVPKYLEFGPLSQTSDGLKVTGLVGEDHSEKDAFNVVRFGVDFHCRPENVASDVLVFDTVGDVETDANLDVLASKIKTLFVGTHNVGFRFETGKIYSFDLRNENYTVRDYFYDGSLASKNALYSSDGRIRINFQLHYYTRVNYATVVALIFDLLNGNPGHRRDSYLTLEGAHMDGSGSGSFGLIPNNKPDNLELIDASLNKKQYHAWSKSLRLGFLVKLSGVRHEDVIVALCSKAVSMPLDVYKILKANDFKVTQRDMYDKNTGDTVSVDMWYKD